MESAPVGGLGPLLLSLALAAGVVAFGVLILRGLFEAIKGLIDKSKGDWFGYENPFQKSVFISEYKNRSLILTPFAFLE